MVYTARYSTVPLRTGTAVQVLICFLPSKWRRQATDEYTPPPRPPATWFCRRSLRRDYSWVIWLPKQTLDKNWNGWNSKNASPQRPSVKSCLTNLRCDVCFANLTCKVLFLNLRRYACFMNLRCNACFAILRCKVFFLDLRRYAFFMNLKCNVCFANLR